MSVLNTKSEGGDPTLIARVQADVRARIADHELAVGAKLPSMRQLCEQHDCSLSVVQMALNGLIAQGWLRSEPRQGVYVAERRTKKRDLVLVLPTLRLEQMDAIIRGVRRGMRESGLHLLITAADSSYEDQIHLLDHLDTQYVAGVLICPPLSNDYATPLQNFADKGVPVVQATHRLDHVRMNTVAVDAYEMGQVAAEKLLEQGHRRIGLVGFSVNSRSGRDCLEGVLRTLESAGIGRDQVPRGHIDPRLLNDDAPWQAGESCAESLLREHTDLSAIITYGHHPGLGAHRAARTLSLHVPAELSIVVIGVDVPGLSLVDPPLSVVANPLDVVCERAVHRLRELIEHGPQEVQFTTLPCRFVERGSIGPARGA